MPLAPAPARAPAVPAVVAVAFPCALLGALAAVVVLPAPGPLTTLLAYTIAALAATAVALALAPPVAVEPPPPDLDQPELDEPAPPTWPDRPTHAQAGPWWAATARPPRAALVESHEAAHPSADYDHPTQLAACPRCSAYEVNVTGERNAYAFGCRKCGHRWDWRPGEEWPATRIDVAPRPADRR